MTLMNHADGCHPPARPRTGFTLIELLVVITLIMILAAMGVMFLPTMGDNARAARGATMLQQWIATARQRALRDQAPRGIRLIPTTSSAVGPSPLVVVRDLQFIEQPDDFTVSPTVPGVGVLSATGGNKYVMINMDVSAQVAIGDYLEVLGSGLMHKIVPPPIPSPPPPPPPPGSNRLDLYSSIPYTIPSTQNYRIVRSPRVSAEDALQMPTDVVIDLSTNLAPSASFPSNLNLGFFLAANGEGSFDIMFAPSGPVLASGVTTDTINLWVRDENKTASQIDGNQTILAVYVRTGLTASQPPAPGADPYLFIKDGRSSGK